MTERQALVKAMLADPDDDLPRLVFADWLDENGDPDRAAFNRLQVEGMRQTGDDRERLLTEAATILDRHYDDWLGPVSRFVWINDHRESRIEQLRRQPFRRGMLFRLAVREDEFIRPETQDLLAAWGAENGIDLLTLTRDESVRAAWSKLGTLAGVVVNTLWGKYTGREPPAVDEVASPVLASVASLDATGATTDDPSLRVLAHSPHVGLLSGLILNDPHCTDVGLDALARTHQLPNLRALNLNVQRRVRFTPDGVLKVLASGRLPKFTTLGLGSVSAVGFNFDLARVLNHPMAGRLTRLGLGVTNALTAVARSRQLTRLESLDLRGPRLELTSEGVTELLANPALARLRELWITESGANGRLTPDDHARLRDRFGDGYTALG
jgi:uncharacterized protein (TIGR02996 family)